MMSTCFDLPVEATKQAGDEELMNQNETSRTLLLVREEDEAFQKSGKIQKKNIERMKGNDVVLVMHKKLTTTGQNWLSVPRGLIKNGFLTLHEIARLKVANSNKLFAQKKLHLVLDLDHTLLHTEAFKKLKPDELYLKEQTDSDTSNGSLYYVKKVAEFLDPEGNYFDTRIIAREDFGGKPKKNLDLVLGQECGTVIVDDTESTGKLHAEMKTDESESEGELLKVLEVLRRMHRLFFDSSVDIKDVRSLRCLRL
ncbi:hypothetical protein Q3G72_030062 [Acer saccharum]|nr:hypothetical protein Q3G72_030062 [Acer saccharum]